MEQTTRKVKSVKPQTVRLIDVFLIGPIMIRAGYLLRTQPIGSIMTLTGVLTVLYNGSNYLKARADEPKAE